MEQLFRHFSIASTCIAVLMSLILAIGVLAKANFSFNADCVRSFRAQSTTCHVISVLFCLLAWLVVSGQSKAECYVGYKYLSEFCIYQGYICLGTALTFILFCMIAALTKRSVSSVLTIKQMRNSFFLTGGIFLIFSFLLDIS